MDYIRIHNSIINNAKSRIISDTYEIHHIVPRSEGGQDVPDNLVKLTPREHYIIHKILWILRPDIRSRVNTFWIMSNYQKITSGRIYETLRNQFILNMRTPKTLEHRKNISRRLAGKPKTAQHIANMKKSLPSRVGKLNTNYGKGIEFIIDGKLYRNTTHVTEVLGVKKTTALYRIKSKNYPNWRFKNNKMNKLYNK